MEKISKKETINNIKYSWKYAKKNKVNLFGYIFFTIVLCIIGAITPMLSAKELLKLSNSLWTELKNVALFILFVEITRNIVKYFGMKNAQLFFKKTLLEVQMDLASKTLALETKVLDQKSSGIFIDRLNKDTNDIANIFTQLNYSITDMITNIGIMIAILFTNIYIFIYYCISFLIIFFFRRIQMKTYFKHDEKFRKIREKNTGLVTEFIRGMRDIKALNAGNNFLENMKERLVESNKEQYKMVETERKFTFITGSIQDILDLLLIILGIYLITKKLLTTSNFVVLFMYRYNVFNLLTYFSQFIERLKNFNLSASRVYEVINSNEFSKEKFGNKHLDKINGDFEFKDVTFSYDDNHKILDKINFKIHANETVAFVGKSGAGKTTIFSLLNKQYIPQSGLISIDGININELDKDSIRNNMTIITQNPYIFNFSIKENLTMIKKDATDEEIIEACKLAQLHDFIMTLDDGYDTKVGEGGVSLSGGQRQRLAIARALIKKTEIILFDEATSALDNETQKSIQKAINNMKGEYTILIIAHRLSTVINSDRILVINEGKVIAEGTHKELLEKSLFYKNLYEEELDI